MMLSLGPWWTNKCVLNDANGKPSGFYSDGIAPAELVANMRQCILSLKGEYMDEKGLSVDYEGIRKSTRFQDYRQMACALKYLDVKSLNTLEKKAFFINIYNSLVIHALVEGLLQSFPGGTLSRLKLYASASYDIGGSVLSLNDIENGILRGNRPAAAPLSVTPFSTEKHPDKLPLVLECDPRVHFALNCGAKSCPPIAVYSSEDLDISLDDVTNSFLDDVEVAEDKEEVTLSMLFKWYRSDFGETDLDILRWIQTRSSGKISKRLESLLGRTSSPKIVYAPYDWSLNSTA